MIKNEENINWFPLVLLFIVVIIIWIISWYLMINSNILSDWDKRGTFGDMFGSVNALFSGLAFAGVIYAIFLQRKELYLQRKELEQTRSELKGQKIQLQEQNKNIKLQRFENTFFNLVELHHDYIDRINVPGFGNNTGRNSFEEFDRKYTGIRKGNVNVTNQSNMKDALTEANKVFRRDYPNYLDIYVRNVINILSFLDKMDKIEKSFYANLFKSQLSNIEIKFLHFFSADAYYGSSYKMLLDKFKITESFKAKYNF